MKIGHKIDSNGFWLEDILEESGITPDVTELCPDGFYKPKWNGTAWVEGLTVSEIDTIKKKQHAPDYEARIASLESALLSLMGL